MSERVELHINENKGWIDTYPEDHSKIHRIRGVYYPTENLPYNCFDTNGLDCVRRNPDDLQDQWLVKVDIIFTTGYVDFVGRYPDNVFGGKRKSVLLEYAELRYLLSESNHLFFFRRDQQGQWQEWNVALPSSPPQRPKNLRRNFF